VQDCLCRNPAPKLHVYADHVFLVLHSPEPGKGGHVHTIELDLFLSASVLVTVHGPLNPVVDPDVSLVETRAVAARIDSGRWTPASAPDLAHALVTALNRHMSRHVADLTSATWELERKVTDGHLGDPETFLAEMFGVMHGLQAVRTSASLDHEVFGRMAKLGQPRPRRAGAGRGRRRPVRARAGDGPGAEGLAAGRDHALPDADQHEDDDRRRAPRRHRRRHAAGDRRVVRGRDERDRQPEHALGHAGRRWSR
jgi:hypothetical protein